MKKFLIFLACQIAAIAAFAQQPQDVNIVSQRYEIAPINMRLNVVNSIMLDTATGELYFVEVRMDADKSVVVKYADGPCENVADSYNGRFAMSYDTKGEIYQVILLDRKLGRVWQTKGGKKDPTLVPLFNPSE